MAKITLKGNPINTIGNLPEVGTQAPDFKLTATDLSDKTLDDFKGSKLVLNIFPSLDTPTCAASVRRFNQLATDLGNTKVLAISKDLPFAHSRFCSSEGIENVIDLSGFKCSSSFGKDYGVEIVDGPLAELFSRAVVIIDENGKVVYTQQVPEIVDEPNYDEVLAALR
ncbi:MAG TPA: thiol peroxidase [Flavobacteriales bacterium]|nr:thiol peroxidase [Flavobacteriales bacterium]